MSKKDKTQVVEPQVAESPKAESEAEKLEKFKAAKKPLQNVSRNAELRKKSTALKELKSSLM